VSKSAYRGTREVYIHEGTTAQRVYSGPYGGTFYEMLKRFITARHAGSGEWFEENTEHGKQWRERGKSGITYEPLESSD
jgi:hypothetical protein